MQPTHDMTEDHGCANDPANGLAITTFFSGENFDQLEAWIKYHSQLIGFHNLHILHFGENDSARKRLSLFVRQGLRISGVNRAGLFAFRKALDREGSAIRYFESIVNFPPFKLIFFLDPSEFIAFNGAQGIGTDRSWIRKEIERLVNTNRTIRIQWGFDPHPRQDNLFQYVPKKRWMVSAHDFQQAGPSWMDKDFSEQELVDPSTALQLLNTARCLPVSSDTTPSPEHLALACQAFSDLLPPSETREHPQSDHKPSNVFDLGGPVAFKPDAYLQYHQDVQSAGMNALAHFTHHGYLEGRLLSDCHQAWHELYERLAHIRRTHPDGRLGYGNLTNAALHCAHLPEAGRILDKALQTFEANPILLHEHALWAMHSASSIEEQIRRWERFIQAAPDSLEGYHACAALHLSAGNDTQAMALTREGLQRFPTHQGMLTLAEELQKNAAVLQQAGLQDNNEAKQLLKRFESLGWSCEFGVVQRRFGLEQLGLLRFTNMSERPLVNAFEDNFKGFRDSTEVKITRSPSKEYLVHVPRYAFGMHSFMTDDHLDVDALQARMARQLAFLRKKFLDDLATGEKIFVQLGSPDATAEDLQQLASAFRKSSKAPLLCVRVSAQEAATAALTEIAPGVLLGHISRRGIRPEHQDIDFAGWLNLCKSAIAHFSTRPSHDRTNNKGSSLELHE